MNRTACPACLGDAERQRLRIADAVLTDCPACGRFTTTHMVDDDWPLTGAGSYLGEMGSKRR